MSVSSVTSSAAASIGASSGINRADWRSTIKQGQQDFSQLLSSLQSGDVSGAQQAFAAMQQLLPGSPSATPAPAATGGTSPAPSTVATDFNALGSALSSGSLTGAQDAVTKLQQDAQTYRQGLQLGHLARAEDVYQSMQQGAASSTASSNPNSSNPSAANGSANSLGADMAALGQALQSGSMTSAQAAYAQLQQDLQSVQQGQGSRHHHHHHFGFGSQNAVSSYLANSVIGGSATAASNADTTGSTSASAASASATTASGTGSSVQVAV